MKIIIEPIGYVFSDRKEPIDDNWKKVESWIELEEYYSEECLVGLENFSHIEVIYYFHKVEPSSIVLKSEHPRENPDLPKTGIFAQRKKARPNLLGLSICKIIKIEGRKIFLEGFDAIDSTPVIDIKPVYKEYLPNIIQEVIQPSWVGELMKDYW